MKSTGIRITLNEYGCEEKKIIYMPKKIGVVITDINRCVGSLSRKFVRREFL